MYEHFDHTADLGLRVRAPDLDQLFAEAATALTAMIVEDISSIEPKQKVALVMAGEDLEFLLLDWLTALLVKFEVERLLFCEFQVRIEDGVLSGYCCGEPFDPERHLLSHEVKAITYHGLRIEESADGWLAEVVVDI